MLSTLHTNTAIGAVTRLQDMGVEPFLLSSSLVAVMAQRLVRLLCTDCRELSDATPTEREMLGVEGDEQVQIYHAKGCAKCNMTGYRGRTGIYELIEVDEELRTAIMKVRVSRPCWRWPASSIPAFRLMGVAEYWR